jgi:hypothetical protein
MALVKGTNSYVTVAEADAYFDDRLNAAAWTSADESTKSKALVTATRLVDDFRWEGAAVSADQALAFPRNGYYFDPRKGCLASFPEGTPQKVCDAVCELALHIMEEPDVLSNSGAVQDLQVDTVGLTKISAAPKIPYSIKRLLNPLLVNGGSNVWWRAN